jgi:hypothetical protein
VVVDRRNLGCGVVKVTECTPHKFVLVLAACNPGLKSYVIDVWLYGESRRMAQRR